MSHNIIKCICSITHYCTGNPSYISESYEINYIYSHTKHSNRNNKFYCPYTVDVCTLCNIYSMASDSGNIPCCRLRRQIGSRQTCSRYLSRRSSDRIACLSLVARSFLDFKTPEWTRMKWTWLFEDNWAMRRLLLVAWCFYHSLSSHAFKERTNTPETGIIENISLRASHLMMALLRNAVDKQWPLIHVRM